MAVTGLQKDVMAAIARNHTEPAILLAALFLMWNWQRLSDDIDIFHDTDEEMVLRRKRTCDRCGYASVRGLPLEWDTALVRAKLRVALQRAEDYILTVPADLTGILSADRHGRPMEVSSSATAGAEFRKATSSQAPIPAFPDVDTAWDTYRN